jgi:hypothetical protein
MARRHRQVIDLYTTGTVAELVDGSPVWVQPLNPFEQDTARNEAQIARARLALALRELGSGEQAKVRNMFFEGGHEAAVTTLVDAKVAEAMPKLLDEFRNDPEWTERLEILDRGDVDTARPLEPEERELLEKISGEFAVELNRRVHLEREYTHAKYQASDEEVLWTDYLDWYIERRTSEVAMAEFRLHQLMFGTRICDGVKDQHGVWDHAACASHQELLFSSKEQVRSAPAQLQALLLDEFDDLELSVREAKNSRRQGSSSDSSPLPSEAAESTASTPSATPVAPPGSSSAPSPTPSPSWAGAS